jgi:para-aminobenzoate synthetase component 1
MTMMTSNDNRKFVSFTIKDIATAKQQVLNWANRFDICCFFDSNSYVSGYGSYECLLAAGVKKSIKANAGNAFEQLKVFHSENPDWLFGHLGYDLKNETEHLTSTHFDGVQFPDLFFFIPEYIILIKGSELSINSETTITAEAVWKEISLQDADPAHPEAGRHLQNPVLPGYTKQPSGYSSRFTRAEYIQAVNHLREHILKGDCYEINFCQEFFIENCAADPVSVYASLCTVSPNPFAAFYKVEDKYLLCASPERYIRKVNDKVISQPIKGTVKRVMDDTVADNKMRSDLLNSSKDRSENVMVVDLVRNDLSKVCKEGSVKVDELYGIYSFPQVHQMISTISGTVRSDIHWADLLQATFPMGSMTGAPKKRVMELIEQYERTKRGLFSGAVGYVTPAGDFDFNVVIRSILVNTMQQYLSCQVGSAITFNSDAQSEYEECLLKAAAIKKVLDNI